MKNLPTVQETPVGLLGREDPPEKGLAAHSSVLGFPAGSAGKESACNVGDLGSIPGLGRSPGEGKGHPPQCSGLESSVDRIVRGVSESGTPERLSLFVPKLSRKLKEGFSGGTMVKNLPANAGDTSSISGLGLSYMTWSY